VPSSGGTSIGSGVQPVNVARHIAGLAPLTTYRYRPVATNLAGTAVGPERTLTTEAPTNESASPSTPPSRRRGCRATAPRCRGANPATSPNSPSTSAAASAIAERAAATSAPAARLRTASPASNGFPGAVFPLARVKLAFAGGKTLSTTLARSCKARG
jgi:hypothetical protein